MSLSRVFHLDANECKTGGGPVGMARPARIELTTHCLEGSCSIQLSYGRPSKEECKRKN
jgi:hypothetical protein